MLFVQTAGKVVNLESAPAAAVKLDDIKASLEQHKPAALFLCQVNGHSVLTPLCSRHWAMPDTMYLITNPIVLCWSSLQG